MADAHKNFARSTVATAPSPATSGTSLVVASGQGALFPTVPFNATIWPVNTQATSTNAEVVRVTARSTDTLTITRAQESSTARTVIVGDVIAATITNKALTDIEKGVGTILLGPTGTTDHVGMQAAVDTLDAAGGGTLQLEGGTYVLSASITVPTRVHIIGQGLSTLVQANAGTVSTGVFRTELAGTSSQWSVQNMRIENTGTAGAAGIGIDASDSSYVRLRNLRMVGWLRGLVLDDTTSTTFYSSFHELDIRDCGICIDIATSGTQPNDHNFYAARCRPIAASATARGVRIKDARGIAFFGLNCESGGTAAANGTGIELTAAARDNVFHNVWVENNAVGVDIASGATRNTFVGGAVTSNTTDITDLGTTTTWLNVNKTGTAQESHVRKDVYDANSLLIATADDTPIALTVAASRIIGRKASGDIVAMTGAEASALLVAASIPIVDSGAIYASDDVEGALQELGGGTDIDTLPGYVHQVFYDGGRGITMTTTDASHHNLSPYVIAADPTIGDQFILESVGSLQALAGSDRNYTFSVYWGSTQIGAMIATGVVSDAVLRAYRMKATVTILTLGAPGVALCTLEGYINDKNLGLSMNVFDAVTHHDANLKYMATAIGPGTTLPIAVDTTTDNNLDIFTKTSSSGGTQTLTSMAITVTKKNAP